MQIMSQLTQVRLHLNISEGRSATPPSVAGL